MAYEQIEFESKAEDLPPKVQAFIDEADRRCDAFYESQLNIRYPRYVPSEPAQVYAALKYVTEQGLPLGQTFLEWGSGFGVATGLAALLGYNATGIEIQEDLVAKAESLLEHEGIVATFIATSYIPEGFIEYENFGTTDIVRDNFDDAPAPSYADMNVDITEIDVFFSYPWPGEQEMMLKLFDALAGEGAILIAYFGDREINIYRKLDDPQL